MTGTLGKCRFASPEWRTSPAPVPYDEAMATMEARVDAVRQGTAAELVWLLEHPTLYTAGTSADSSELLDPTRFPVHHTGRGGRYTYHGPGQRVIYVISDLRARGQDLRAHIYRLEDWILRVLADFGVVGERREGRVGIWVVLKDGREAKIAALGVRVRGWIAYHGLALNVCPDLEAFKGIVPCGLPDFGVTSLRNLGIPATMEKVDEAFKRHWNVVFEK